MHKGRDTQKIPFSEVPNGSGQTAGEVDPHGVQMRAVFMPFKGSAASLCTPRVHAGLFFSLSQRVLCLLPSGRREGCLMEADASK
jgi:hypothetical protein